MAPSWSIDYNAESMVFKYCLIPAKPISSEQKVFKYLIVFFHKLLNLLPFYLKGYQPIQGR